MKFSGKVSRKFGSSRFSAITKAADEAMLQLVEDGVLAIHEEAVKGIMKRSSGEVQRRYNPKRIVVASKPGDPPNVDMGVFVKSVQFQVDENKLRGAVGTNDERGPWFEFGTANMAARPWLTPAWKKAQKIIKSLAKKIKLKVG